MRRTAALLAVPVMTRRAALLLTLPAALLHAPTASAACVTSTGITVCPPVYTCGPGSIVTVTVVGVGAGSASCGGATATCYSFRAACSDTATASSYGVLTCSHDAGRAAVTCTASPGPR